MNLDKKGLKPDSPGKKGRAKESEGNSGSLEALISASPIAMIALDQAANVLVWNPAAENLFGWSHDEVLGKPYPLVPDDGREDFRELIKREFSGIHHSAKDVKRVHKDGTLIDVTLWTAPMFDEHGRMYAVLGLLADNTLRKHTERQITLQSAALNASANAIMITDSKGSVAWVNPAFTTLTGYEPDEVMGKNPRQLVKSGKHDMSFYRDLWNTIISGNVWRGETINRRKDGSLYVEDQTISPVTENGEVTHFIAIKQDITKRKETEESLKLFRTLIDQSRDAIEIIDPESGCFIDVNDNCCRELDYSKDEMLNLDIFDIDPTMHRANFRKKVKDLFILKTLTWESFHKRKNGTTYPVDVNMTFVSLDRDYIVSVVRDISERRIKDEKIMRLNRLYKVLSGINSLLVREHKLEDLFQQACRVAVEEGEFRMAWIGELSNDGKSVTTHASAGQVNGFTWHIQRSVHGDTSEENNPWLQAIRQEKTIIMDSIPEGSDIDWMKDALECGFKSLVVLPLKVTQNVRGIVSLYASTEDFFDDVEIDLLTELAGDISFAMHHLAQREKADYLSSFDPLTGLANRSLFFAHLNSVLERARKSYKNVALFACDLRYFRNINNVHGTGVGDKVLQETAARLHGLTSDPVNVGRITGDCFIMILHDVGNASWIPSRLEKKFFPALNKPFVVNDKEIQGHFAGGIAVYPMDGNSAETLYSSAEAALKKAKAENVQYLFYQPGMMEGVAERLSFENSLRHALENEEFVLHYQPKIDTAAERITGLEALIRWNNPATGIVPPDMFIPVLEETGMILDVGNWVIEKALQDLGEWKKNGIDIPRVAVNVSPIQLQHKSFHDVVTDITCDFGGSTCGLDLELTESLLMHDIEVNSKKLAAIRELGVDIVIDDFGTGYSSLSYLAKLPVNSLKIDRSFIATMDDKPESMNIVSGIINLAHSLNLKVIAEGVETDKQSMALRSLKCDEMQGYLYSKPVPSNEIPATYKLFE